MFIKYTHGSEDSTDIDVMYVFDSLPTKQECKEFCSADPTENRNICVINDGEVVACYKGTPDEINNALLDTYYLHRENLKYPLLVTHKVDRDLTVKCIRCIRIILSHLSHSQYREKIKHALVSDLKTRIDTLREIDFSSIDFNSINKKMSREDILKTIAFQVGQTQALLFENECYTKSTVAEQFPPLEQFLYRHEDSDVNVLETYLHWLLNYVECYLTVNGMTVTNGMTTYDIITEQKI